MVIVEHFLDTFVLYIGLEGAPLVRTHSKLLNSGLRILFNIIHSKEVYIYYNIILLVNLVRMTWYNVIEIK